MAFVPTPPVVMSRSTLPDVTAAVEADDTVALLEAAAAQWDAVTRRAIARRVLRSEHAGRGRTDVLRLATRWLTEGGR